jgi:putative ABC transport system permease protein
VVVGRLARENALRNPARSAATASALMVGLAVMLFVTVFASSARSSIERRIDRDFTGDLAIVNRDGSSPIPVAAAQTVRAVPGVRIASVLKRSDSRVDGEGSEQANGVDPQTLLEVYRFDWVEGSDTTVGLLGPSGALVEKRLADRANLHVGETFDARSPSGQRAQLLVRGVYRDQGLLGGYTVGLPSFNDFFGQRRAAQILVKLATGADPRRVLPAVDRALRPFPDARARSQRQLAAAQARRVDSILYLLYALLALSVVVSLFGLVNTLSLSVHERTRELGLMRALGSTRRSLRRAVRYESVIIAGVGATMGAVLGLLLAVTIVSALSSEGLELSIPWATLAGLLGLALVLAVLAAVAPARRASRLDILSAIAYE